MEKDKLYIRHILEAIEKIRRYVGSASFQEFDANELLQDAVVRELEIIGEAAKHLSEEFRSQHPAIPWEQIAGMRDKLIHEYFGVDTEIVWKTITEDLEPVRRALTGES